MCVCDVRLGGGWWDLNGVGMERLVSGADQNTNMFYVCVCMKVLKNK